MIPRLIKVELLGVAHHTWHICNKFIFIIIYAYYHLLYMIEQANRTCDYLSVNNFPIKDLRVPKHIAFSFTNEANQPDLESIARLICWSKQLGISYITLYDDYGCLKDSQSEVIKYFGLIMRSLGCEKPINMIEGLNIISSIDGRRKFLDDTKELVKLKPEDISLEQVQSRVGWPTDPELLINFGYPMRLYGFPPWQLRLTEILSIPTHRRIPQKIFLDCFRKYSKTSQREGV